MNTLVAKYAPSSTLAPAPRKRWSLRSILLLLLAWSALQIGGLFTPGLLDDVDSVYIQIAREMLQRHDFITPTIDGIRFFDKPPLMYWMAAGSMRLFGIHDWAARLPLALGVLALLLAVYALGIRLFNTVSPLDNPDRGGLYAALAMATSIGPYLYTRFYIPDILIALWMTLSVHLFLVALDRLREGRSPLLPSLGFAVVMALDVLTKGLIGIVFPLGFVLLYLLFTRRLKLLLKLQIPAATGLFLLLAAPWHILAALRNPAISMPAGLGLPARAGWAWFYLYNEHIARFLGRRIPHDYGQVPIPLFWLLLVLWLVPWSAFLPAALVDALRDLRQRSEAPLRFDSDIAAGYDTATALQASAQSHEAALSLLLWAGIILGFFTLSSRQEYYHLPALPALALLVGGMLAAADPKARRHTSIHAAAAFGTKSQPQIQALNASLYFLVPLGSLLFLVCSYLAITAHTPPTGVDLNALLSSNPALYNLSLGHVFDLTGNAMGFFRGPLWTVALCMLALGPGSHLLRRRGRTLAANLVIAASMAGVLLAAHEGLVRFYPILGSKGLAQAIDTARRPGDIVVIDGELTSGSTLLFYTGQPTLLVNGRINGPWFGGFWPDAPHIFEDEAGLHHLWSGPQRVFLLTYNRRQRQHDLSTYGNVIDFADSGGKTILTNR
ncbi:glycosyltransferase family 39 protein [Granulicella sp. S156]|uniref:ArnT family glycosyltransferase n=1 Tax=Granulicella sp. S156 TaxID=1747224 RepID=UPI0020B11300|nr:glycosyltransferase family 39 protein [Granulicella sp. S156]